MKIELDSATSKTGNSMEVEASGLHLMPDRSFIGASSDGKVLCKILTLAVGDV